MTYIDYLNAFNQWCEEDSPTDKAIILYYAMLSMFNRRGWPRWAGVDTQLLMRMCNTASNKTALRARDALVRAGFIEYKSGHKGKATEYHLLEKCVKYYCKNDIVNDTVNDTVSDTVNDTVNDTPNKTKTKNNPPLIPPQGETGFGPELQSAFEAWLAYKQEKNQGYKPVGLKSLVTSIRKNAEKYGEQAVVDLIVECMASNWQGIIFKSLSKTKGAAPKSSRDTIKTSADYDSGDSFI